MGVMLVGAAVLLACLLAAVQLFRRLPRTTALIITSGLVGGLVGIPLLLLAALGTESNKRIDLEHVRYEQSRSCVKCHPDHYRTWKQTYHRTMTQNPLPDAIIGDFNDVRVEYLGHETRFFREGDRFFVESTDHEWERAVREETGVTPAQARRRVYSVDRLVGSHHQQIYLSLLDNGEYFILPFLWNRRDQKWLPMTTVFLSLEDGSVNLGYTTTWNQSCIFCHNTGPNPGMEVPGAGEAGIRWDVHLQEIGIACEACHGPAEAHIESNLNLIRRQYLIETGKRDPTIVNAKRMRKVNANQACGRCHGKWGPRPEHTREILTRGDKFIPGRKDLNEIYVMPLLGKREYDPARDADYFWPDGSPRATALEYQGTVLSPCTERGKMTCLSCHSMHDSDPDDQLKFPEDPTTPELERNEQCLQCHPQFRGDDALVAHTHHPVDSAASDCATCHMPFQTYGILSAHRAHRIQNPVPEVSARDSTPNGCNQCHVDKSLRWTADALAQWNPDRAKLIDHADLFAGERTELSETLLQLGRGHALSRAIAVQMLSDANGLEAAPGLWRVPFLIDALDDSYAVVRLNSLRSIRQMPGFENVVFNHFGPDSLRNQQIARIWDRWDVVWSEHASSLPKTIPLNANGRIKDDVRRQLRANRDNIVLNIQE